MNIENQSSLPLDYKHLLKKIQRCQGAKYKLVDRSYDGIVWMDNRMPKPTLKEFEAAFMHLHENPLDDYVDENEINKYLQASPSMWQKFLRLLKIK